MIPAPGVRAGLHALAGLKQRGALGALEVFHQHYGNIFRLPWLNTVVMVGPDALRFVLVTARDGLHWRNEGDPIVRLLRHGVLVEDGPVHDDVRRAMMPAMHRSMLASYIGSVVQVVDDVAGGWQTSRRDMLVEMRRVALLALSDVFFGYDLRPHLESLLPHVLRAVRYVGPGAWVGWNRLSAPGAGKHAQIDTFVRRVIAESQPDHLPDMLRDAGLSEDRIRDQLMTLMIAGQDTSTVALAWALYNLGQYPAVQAQAREEVRTVIGDGPIAAEHLGQLVYLDRVIDETLRLYPPIHTGTRVALHDLRFQNYTIAAGQRVFYSIYLTHRDPHHWRNPHRFDPERFIVRPQPYTFLPFGGGPRNCLGAAFARMQIKLVLARLLQRFTFNLEPVSVRLHMGAALTPHPGVWMNVT